MMTVKEVSRLTGVSVRTLQYYDNRGLLRASAYTDAGYRLYDEKALERLQQILLFRELEFPLKDIERILRSPDFDRDKALAQQIALLTLKKEHIEGLILLAQEIRKGGRRMDFSPFDPRKRNEYAKQAWEAWGSTPAYGEFEEKARERSAETEAALGRGLMEIFEALGREREGLPDSKIAQKLIKKLQSYISEHYYRCTDQILESLGEMYGDGGQFTRNIDRVGGPGTAAFTKAAIQIYCRKKK